MRRLRTRRRNHTGDHVRPNFAARTGVPAAPVRDVLGSTDVALAYEVQNVLTAARKAAGARVVGRKVDLTSPVVQRQLGVGQPDFGVLFDDMLVPSGGVVDSGRLNRTTWPRPHPQGCIW